MQCFPVLLTKTDGSEWSIGGGVPLGGALRPVSFGFLITVIMSEELLYPSHKEIPVSVLLDFNAQIMTRLHLGGKGKCTTVVLT